MMKTTLILPGLCLLALGLTACCRTDTAAQQGDATDISVVLRDYGSAPTVLNIETYTLANDNFRTALWTGDNLQVTLMSIPAGEDVGLERHDHLDQFLRIEQGTAKVTMGDTPEGLDFVRAASDDDAIFVPAGKWHNIVNTGDKPMKIYSIYAPAEHPRNTVHKNRREAMEAEHQH